MYPTYRNIILKNLKIVIVLHILEPLHGVVKPYTRKVGLKGGTKYLHVGDRGRKRGSCLTVGYSTLHLTS